MPFYNPTCYKFDFSKGNINNRNVLLSKKPESKVDLSPLRTKRPQQRYFHLQATQKLLPQPLQQRSRLHPPTSTLQIVKTLHANRLDLDLL